LRRRARRWRVPLLALALAGVALLLAGAIAIGRGTTTPRAVIKRAVLIQAVFDNAGNPSLVANFTGAGPPPRWSICSPAPTSACHAVPKARHAILDPGPEPAGTVFVATDTARGRTYSARVKWQGRVTNLAPPSIVGAPRFGTHVTVAAGAWAGGWGTESDQVGVEACQTPQATGCVVLSGGEYGCPGQPPNATVGGWLPGMYLFAFDLRVARDAACAGVGYSYPGAVRPWPVNQVTARSAPAGPVTGPSRPTVMILATAHVRYGRLLVAHVHCSTRCRVWLSAFDGESSSGARVAVTGTATVGVPRRGLVPGRLSVTLHVDDGPQIAGKSRFPAS
jgi:hypothetical protein